MSLFIEVGRVSGRFESFIEYRVCGQGCLTLKSICDLTHAADMEMPTNFSVVKVARIFSPTALPKVQANFATALISRTGLNMSVLKGFLSI